MPETAPASAAETIELRLQDASQLFNMLDPFPFRERDLSAAAEQYIVERAEGLPKNRPIEIRVHVEADGRDQGAARDIPQAIPAWFAARAQDETHELQTLFRDGRLALLIGAAAVVICLFAAWQLSLHFEGTVADLLKESFVIIGWVVVWRPAEMFLYDWVAPMRRRRLFRRLAAANVTVRPVAKGS